jgi:cephalosporin hydroxylase
MGTLSILDGAYECEFPNDYKQRVAREDKFGWTFAPNRFLIHN